LHIDSKLVDVSKLALTFDSLGLFGSLS